MATQDRAFNFAVLRMIVIAMHRYGIQLKGPGLTFSHGNVGNQYLEIAAFLDALVADSEPGQNFVLVRETKLQADAQYLAGRCEFLEELRQFTQKVQRALGLPEFNGKKLDEVVALVDGLRLDLLRERLAGVKKEALAARKLGEWMANFSISFTEADNPYGPQGPLYDGADSQGLALEWSNAYQNAAPAPRKMKASAKRK